jgi:hypothetical protein
MLKHRANLGKVAIMIEVSIRIDRITVAVLLALLLLLTR